VSASLKQQNITVARYTYKIQVAQLTRWNKFRGRQTIIPWN